MRVSMLVVVLATLTAIPDPVRADDYGDLDQCRFVGQIGRADRSIAACDRVLGDAKLAAPSRVAALSSRCGWWWTKKDPDRALPDCDEAIRIDRGYVPAYVNRGNAYLNKGDSERAFADFNEAIRLDPNSAWAYNARGDLYKSRGELDHAMTDFNEAIRLDPNYAMAYFFRSNLHKMAGDFAHALADLNQSIRLDPGDAMAYFTRGSVSYLMGDTPGALADLHHRDPVRPQRCRGLFQPRRRLLHARRSHRGRGGGSKKGNRTRPQGRLCRALARPGRAAQQHAEPFAGDRQATGQDGLARARDQ